MRKHDTNCFVLFKLYYVIYKFNLSFLLSFCIFELQLTLFGLSKKVYKKHQSFVMSDNPVFVDPAAAKEFECSICLDIISEAVQVRSML